MSSTEDEYNLEINVAREAIWVTLGKQDQAT